MVTRTVPVSSGEYKYVGNICVLFCKYILKNLEFTYLLQIGSNDQLVIKFTETVYIF